MEEGFGFRFRVSVSFSLFLFLLGLANSPFAFMSRAFLRVRIKSANILTLLQYRHESVHLKPGLPIGPAFSRLQTGE